MKNKIRNKIFRKSLFVNVVLCLLLLTFVYETTAQSSVQFKGELVRVDGDTIFCEVKIKSYSSNIVKIKQADFGRKFKDYPLSEIKSISGGNELEYLVFPIQEGGIQENVLVKKVVSGAINLYKGKTSKKKDIYFINSNDIPQIVQIHPKGVNSFIKNYFRDCPQKEERIYYKYSQILEALKYYHSCLYKGEKFEVLEKPDESLKIGLGYRGLYFRTEPIFEEGGYFSRGKFDSNPSGGGGILAKVYLKRNWGLEFGANLLKYKFSSEEILNPSGNYSSAEIKMTILEMPLAVSYSFNLPLEPHFLVGYSVDFLINPKVDEQPFKSTSPPVSVTFKNENIGFFAGVGVKKNLTPRTELLLQIKYYRENIRVLTNHFDSSQNDYIISERRLNPNRVEVSASYIFFVKNKNQNISQRN